MPGPFDPVVVEREALAHSSTLEPFAGCDELLAHLKTEAAARIGRPGTDPVGFPSGGITPARYVEQERGEIPESVKTDDKRMVVLRSDELQVFDLTTQTPARLGHLDGLSGQLLLAGETVLLLSNKTRKIPTPPLPLHPLGAGLVGDWDPVPWPIPFTVIREIDISDPSRMRVVATLTIDGTVAAHQFGDTVRMVIEHAPIDLGWVGASHGSDPTIAEQINSDIIQDSDLADWLPGYTFDSNGNSSTGRISACSEVLKPTGFSGFSTSSMVTVDLADGLNAVNGIAVLGESMAKHVSAEHVFIATERVSHGDHDAHYDVHKFSFDGEDRTIHEASGPLSDSYWGIMLSEQDGTLRVVGQPISSTMQVTVFEQRGRKLSELGRATEQVDGREERYERVHLVGHELYLVVYRQDDKRSRLRVVDLSNPTATVSRDELTFSGFAGSPFLVAGADRLIAIGESNQFDDALHIWSRDVNPSTRAGRDPNSIIRYAATDVRAAAWDEQSSRLIMPIRFTYPIGRSGSTPTSTIVGTTTTSAPEQTLPFYPEPIVGAAVMHVSSAAITGQGTVRHPSDAAIEHSIIHDDRLITISSEGISTNRLSDLAALGWLPG